jgi:enoyl-[acyl-carrier protein] reductase I
MSQDSGRIEAVAAEGAREELLEVPRPSLGGLFKGKRALVTGIANERSIAWAIAQAFHAEGAELVFTYPGEAMGRRVKPLVETLAPRAVLDCDVGKDEDIDRTVGEVSRLWDRLDILIHSIGFAPRAALEGRFTEVTTREAWAVTMDVSAYSLVGLTRAFRPLMTAGSNVLSLTYYGAEKVVRNYNVMGVAKAALECSTRYLADDLGLDGIRVNTISAGPLKTLAAAGIRGMRAMLAENAERTPLRRNIDQDDVARAALYLCSDLARNVTGEVLHVDAGQNILGTVSMG